MIDKKEVKTTEKPTLTSNLETNNSPKTNEPAVAETDTTDEVYDLYIPPNDLPPPEDYDDIPYDDFDDKEPVSKVVLNDAELSAQNLSARRLWGVLTLKLREKKYVTLHTACGEIRDVVRDGDKITANVYEEYLYNILTNAENFDKILLELKAIDAKITLEFILKQTGKTRNKLNLGQLQNLFGDALRFN